MQTPLIIVQTCDVSVQPKLPHRRLSNRRFKFVCPHLLRIVSGMMLYRYQRRCIARPPKGTGVLRCLRQALPARQHLHPISDAVEALRESLLCYPARRAGSALAVCEQRSAIRTTRQEAQLRTRRPRSRWRDLPELRVIIAPEYCAAWQI